MAAPMEEDVGGGAGSSGAKLFLGGLSWDTTDDKLKEYFSKYGTVEDVVVMKDRVTKRPRGFGFITFSDPSAAQAACSETHTIDGRQIDAKPSVPHGKSSQPPRSKKIFVGGLAPETDDTQLKGYFEQFGVVAEALVLVDHNSGRSRGFGFVTFEDEDSVAKVFSAGSMHDLGGKQVEVKSATPKGGSGPQSGRGAGPVGGRGGGAFGRGPYPAGGRGAFFGQAAGLGYGAGYGAAGYGAAGFGYGQGFQVYGAAGWPQYGMMAGYGPYGAYQGYPPGYGQGGYSQGQGQGGADSRYHPYGQG